MKSSIDISALFKRATSNISIILTAGLLILVLAEGLVIKHSVDIILSSKNVIAPPNTSLVRINFDLYNKIAQRFAEGESVPLTPVTGHNPFTPPKAVDPVKIPAPKPTPTATPTVPPVNPIPPITP